MTSVVITTVAEHRGSPRIWLEGRKLQRGGFRPGQAYRVEEHKNGFRLVKTGDCDRVVSRKKKRNFLSPVIDLHNRTLLKWFEVGAKLRIVIRQGRVTVRRHTHVQSNRIAERVSRLITKLEQQKALDVHSLFHGGGIIDAAIHSGLKKSGVSSFVQVAVERSSQYLDLSLDRHPELFTDSSILIEANIQELDLTNVPPCDAVVLGLPCTGASIAGLASNKIENPEDHPEAGPLFFYFLNWVRASNPALIILENVKTFARTASMIAIRAVLKSLGYCLQERIVKGTEFGALEARERLCLVAVSEGLDLDFSLESVESMYQKPATLGEALEPITLDDPRWRSYDYLKKKQKADKAKGNHFARQLFTPADKHISTLTRSYHKGGSTVPFIVHPEDPELSRKVTALEHSRVKGINEHFLKAEEMTETLAHEVMGQSVTPGAFEAVAFNLGQSLSRLANPIPTATAA